MLTEHEIAATWESITRTKFSPGSMADDFARAIESAACAPLLERIEELEAAYKEMMQLAASGADYLVKSSQTIAALEAKLAQRVPDEAIRSTLGYIAAYDPEELDAMPKGRLLQRTRAIINVARNTLSAAPAAPEQQEPTAEWKPSTRMWHDRIKDAHPRSEPEYWPNALKVEYMEQEILDLRRLVAQAPNAQQATCRSANPAAKPAAKPPARPDDTCPLVECRAIGGCAVAAQQAEAQPAPEALYPIAWYDEVMDKAYTVTDLDGGDPGEFVPLYTAQPKAVPLTPDQIENGAEIGEFDNLGRWQIFEAGVRFAEAAHGIGAPAEKGGE